MNFNVKDSVKRGNIGTSVFVEKSSTSSVSFFILSKLLFSLISSVLSINVLNESSLSLN